MDAETVPGPTKAVLLPPEERICGNCSWLHPESPQYRSDSHPETPWCWATPVHCQRHPSFPPCAFWLRKAG